MIVTQIFPLADKKKVFVHLASFDWDLSVGRDVKLVQGDTVVEARQDGSGNIEGNAMVVLDLAGEWDDTITVLHKMEASGQPISIEFI